MKETLNMVVAILLSCIIIKGILVIIERIGIDFVGFFQFTWEKTRKKK